MQLSSSPLTWRTRGLGIRFLLPSRVEKIIGEPPFGEVGVSHQLFDVAIMAASFVPPRDCTDSVSPKQMEATNSCTMMWAHNGDEVYLSMEQFLVMHELKQVPKLEDWLYLSIQPGRPLLILKPSSNKSLEGQIVLRV
ncbi:unnamed protein product [Citrullus colocynthis]|uniref:Uncharacterized protein n=1 Tax=Citrullus colocynthis TaxID=252529 RepID=A0ABP0XZU5_9ROSI